MADGERGRSLGLEEREVREIVSLCKMCGQVPLYCFFKTCGQVPLSVPSFSSSELEGCRAGGNLGILSLGGRECCSSLCK